MRWGGVGGAVGGCAGASPGLAAAELVDAEAGAAAEVEDELGAAVEHTAASASWFHDDKGK